MKQLQKTPFISSAPHDYSIGIVNCLKSCAADYKMDLKEFFRKVEVFIIHGSTIATNTVIQWKGAKVGIICTMGHNSILWKREGKWQDLQ